jgi:hypothetical protein
MEGVPGAETRFISELQRLPTVDCDQLTFPMSSHGELADGGRS